MRNLNFIRLAEKYCEKFHERQRRKGGNQEPYANHPFAVRDILVGYGYDDPETQAVCLLHDTLEDTGLGYSKGEIERAFTPFVYQGVYVVSKNTIGKHAATIDPLFEELGVEYLVGGELTDKAYKLRLLCNPDTFKRVKIGDTIHNTCSLPELSKSGIEKKIHDAETFYIPMGEAVAPIMVDELKTNIYNYKRSEHYRELFGT